MVELGTHVLYVNIKQQGKEVFRHISKLYIKVTNLIVVYAASNQVTKVKSICTLKLYMEELKVKSFLANNATTRQQRKVASQLT